MYQKLIKLPFPAGRAASTQFKLDLLDEGLHRNVCTKDLFSKGLSRRRTKFDMSYFTKHKWLFAGDEGIFWIYCKLFLTSQSQPNIPGGLLSKPWTNYSKKQKLDEHANVTLCKYHDVAECAAKNFWAVETGKRANIKYAAAGMTEDVAEVRELVKEATVIIAMAAKQNIPLRGHRDEALTGSGMSLTTTDSRGDVIVSGDINGGNFKALMRYGATCGVDILKELDVLGATYTSAKCQNELINLMADDVRRSLIELMNGTVFTVIADETTDASTVEQLCVAVRFVSFGDDGMSPQLQERFLCFRRMSSVTGKLQIHNTYHHCCQC